MVGSPPHAEVSAYYTRKLYLSRRVNPGWCLCNSSLQKNRGSRSVLIGSRFDGMRLDGIRLDGIRFDGIRFEKAWLQVRA
jgi:hypothetical protein